MARRAARTPEQVVQAIRGRLVEVRGCLEWPGAVFPGGYGLISWQGKHHGVHRLLWELSFGPLESDLVLDHKCRNKVCANLAHLQPVTHAANMQNRSMASRANSSGVLDVLHRVRGNSSRFYVKMNRDGTTYNFGGYATLAEAAEVAREKRQWLFPNSNPAITTT